MDRVRTLYGKFIEYDPTNVTAWVMFAELEGSLQEEERARSLHELALSQPVLNQPEALWMHYIDYELSVGDRPAARALYDRLLERTQHVKVCARHVPGKALFMSSSFWRWSPGSRAGL